MKVILPVLFVLFFFAAASYYLLQPRMPNKLGSSSELESYLSRLVASNNPPGLSVAVVKDGWVVYRYSVGIANPIEASQITEGTVYHWWSMTKIATALGIMQLHERGKLHIDDPVVSYLAWFVSADPNVDLSTITIRQLLRHTSGLPDMVPAMIGWVRYEEEFFNQAETLKQLLPKYARLRYEPDQKAAYTNFGSHPLGWAEYRHGERPWLQHRGGGPGFATIMRIYPRESLGIVIMANGTNLPSEQIVDALATFSWE